MKKNDVGDSYVPLSTKTIRIMKITTILLLCVVCSLSATTSYGQSYKLSISKQNSSILEILRAIEEISEFTFFFNDNAVNANQKASVNVKNATLEEALQQVLRNTGYEYQIFDRQVLIKSSTARVDEVQQQNTRRISGTVTDENGEPIIGANVVQEGTTNGNITNLDGGFVLNISPGSNLEVSYIGFVTQIVSTKDKTQFNIVLKENLQLLEEVVVVGYGVQRKAVMTGAVSTVKSEDFKKSSSSNLSDALVGRLPGLIAVNESGKPGAGSKLYIRGMGTWNNSDPLVIVDGIERDFTHLDPNEIETVSILKDASSAAVYGSRAANGVILVTTKRGKDGKPSISLDTYYGMKDFTRYPELAKPYEWGVTRNNAYLMDGISQDDPRIIKQDQLDKLKSGEAGTDWFKESFKSHASQYYVNLSISGGNERVKYFIAGGHHSEDGIVDNFNYKKYNIRSNLDAKITDGLNISANLDANSRTYNTPGWTVENIFSLVPRQNPSLIAYHPNGLAADGGGGEHLPEMIHNSGNEKTTYNSFRASVNVDFKIPGVEGLVAKGMYSYGKNYMYNKKFFIPYSMYQINEQGEITSTKVVGEKTKLDEKFDQTFGYTYNLSLNYSRRFGKHDIGAMVLYEQEVSDFNEFSAFRTNFTSNSIPQLNAGGELDKSNAGKATEWARDGYVGRLNYAYDETYMFETSFRYDGSITFPKGNRYGFFPSFSAAWRISNESFIKDNVSFIDNLKLRASYGTLGNDRVKLWQYLSEFTYDSTATIGGNNVSSVVVYKDLVPNPNITWEKSSTFDVGVEGIFWKGMLSFELDYFYKRTKDILAPQIRTIPETFGAALPDVNYGILDNKGFEIILNHTNKIGDITYNIGGNFSYVKNKVIQFDETDTTPEYYKIVGKSFTHVTDGRPYSGLVGMKALGFFQNEEEIAAWPKQFNGGQKPGDIKYEDVNKDGVIDANDLTVVDPYGSIPEIVYGFNLGVGWKGFQFSALFQGAAHKSIMLSSYGRTMFLDGTSNFFRYLLTDSWTPDNRNAKYPRAYVGGNTNNNQASNIWVKNGDYLRLKNVELSYTFPAAMLAKTKVINAMRVYVTGTNLLTFDKLKVMDPESPSGSVQYYPQMKSVNFGINITY